MQAETVDNSATNGLISVINLVMFPRTLSLFTVIMNFLKSQLNQSDFEEFKCFNYTDQQMALKSLDDRDVGGFALTLPTFGINLFFLCCHIPRIFLFFLMEA